jgi:hypothetical protein
LDIVLLKLLTAVNPEDIEVFVRATASANDWSADCALAIPWISTVIEYALLDII